MSTSIPSTELHRRFEALSRQVGDALRMRWRRQLPEVLIRRALAEAAQTAQATEWPTLFFPTLAEERVQSVHDALRTDFSRCAA